MTIDDLTVSAFLDAVGSRAPVPGGGAVASVVGGLGAALGQMVLHYSVGKRSLAEHEAANRADLERLGELRRRALDLATADAEAYGRLNELWKLPAEDPRRTAEWDDAVEAAINAPGEMVRTGLAMLDCLGDLTDRTNRLLASDLAIAAVLAEAAVRAAGWNVRINLPHLADADRAARVRARLAGELAEARTRAERIEAACVDG